MAGGQTQASPRCTDHQQGGHHDGQERELDGLDELVATCPGTHRRDQADDEEDEGHDEEGQPAGPVHYGGLRCVGLGLRKLRWEGPVRLGPAGHRWVRRWKNPHNRTTNSVPRGMASVSTCGPMNSSVAMLTFLPTSLSLDGDNRTRVTCA